MVPVPIFPLLTHSRFLTLIHVVKLTHMEKGNSQKKERMFSWMNSKLEVRDTGKYGKGVFATENLQKNDILAMFGGYVMTLDEESLLPENIRDLGHQISDDFVIGINDVADLQSVDYFNHSCNPNAGINGQIFLVAMEDVIPDEQICFDYAMTVGGDEPYSLECLCGSENCRRVISNTDWENPELQKKYRGYFQWYLQEKINKLQQAL